MAARPPVEVADILRIHGTAYRQQHKLPLDQLRIMRAIENCRTSALGGHMEGTMRPLPLHAHCFVTVAATATAPRASLRNARNGTRPGKPRRFPALPISSGGRESSPCSETSRNGGWAGVESGVRH